MLPPNGSTDNSQEGSPVAAQASVEGSPDAAQASLPVPLVSSSEAAAAAECLKVLQRLKLEPAEPVSLDKADVSRGQMMNGDQEYEVITNVYGIRTKPTEVYQYHCEFFKVYVDGKKAGEDWPLFAETADRKLPDYYVRERREQHQKLMKKIMEKYPDYFGNDPNLFCFDYAKTLFALVPLSPSTNPFELTPDETNALINRPFAVKLRITPPPNNVFNVRDFVENFSSDLSDVNSNVTRFLELATSHTVGEHPEEHVMYEAKKTYFMNPQKYGFGLHNLEPPKCLYPGAAKTVVCLEGPRQKGVPAMVVDSKKTPFYLPSDCVNLVFHYTGDSGQFNPRVTLALEPIFRKLVVIPVHRPNVTILIKRLHSRNAIEESFLMDDGSSVSVFDYFRNKYQKTLQYPNWPLAAYKVRGKNMFLPLETLKIADNQRCKNITSLDIASIVKACAVPPIMKIQEVQSCYGSFGLDQDAFCKNAQLAVMNDALKVHAKIIPPPQIQYANGNLFPDGGKWRLPKHAKYVKPVQCKNWYAILLRFSRDRHSGYDQYNSFVQRYVSECHMRGLAMDNPVDVWEVNYDIDDELEQVFRDAKENKVEFILIGHPDQEKTLHPVMKYYERKYGVITQCVNIKTVNNVMTKSPLSLENIVAKTNVKLGGLNYNIALPNYAIDPKVLFIGLGMNHPAGGIGTHPDGRACENVSILGFAANDGKLPNEFIGNFFFQPQFRDEKLSVLDELLDEVLERFKKNRGYAPSRVIFYRSGCSEGQFQSVLRYEIPVINYVIGKHAPGAPISVIIPSKLHPLRFFKPGMAQHERPPAQNIPPGTVVDTNVVHHTFSEFYLNSHSALQGTAKTPKYTVLYTSEKKATLDMFQRWTNALCYNFQIVTSPTSLPAPVYVANRYAERGRQIFNVNENMVSSGIGSGSGNGDGNGNGNGHVNGNGNGVRISPEEVTKNKYYIQSTKLNFTNVPYLRDKRVNA